ncbi:hypothetical protein O6H91_02G010900 [Diphasiastrum complanatum]|uniref:Uncharacterized protein n=1 Tax=Diphasiastrum complanatum TaxID=34168 RepID=A0ACC2ECV5_DIPCM|nr:hypothetical protein O6H91_02G010900 [Diphasiastrum complanatum]
MNEISEQSLNMSAAQKNEIGEADCSAFASAPSSADSNLYEFICQGHLFRKAGLSPESVAANLAEWQGLGLKLSQFLGFNPSECSASERQRIYHYYLPVFWWCKDQLSQHRSQFQNDEPIPALVVGLSAPQGCGKTTLVDALEYLFNATGSRAASVSIDDFYLTAADQEKLAAENAGNALLEFRGNAGTHDLQLGTEALKSLRGLTSAEAKTKIPHYEKSSHHGHGDRANPSTWREVQGPLEVLLFEGWMLGFEPREDPKLVAVNKNLKAYSDAWFSLVDSWIIIEVEDPNWVFTWRLQAEVRMRAEGRPGMTDAEVADFVSRYMPAYKAYLPILYSKGPSNAKPHHTLRFKINKDRTPAD